MHLRKENGWELWQGFHPSSIGCSAEGREVCTCKYHIVNDERTEIHSFDDYLLAEKKFRELTGGLEFLLGKTKFDNGKVVTL
jgi:hypothetical protein